MAEQPAAEPLTLDYQWDPKAGPRYNDPFQFQAKPREGPTLVYRVTGDGKLIYWDGGKGEWKDASNDMGIAAVSAGAAEALKKAKSGLSPAGLTLEDQELIARTALLKSQAAALDKAEKGILTPAEQERYRVEWRSMGLKEEEIANALANNGAQLKLKRDEINAQLTINDKTIASNNRSADLRKEVDLAQIASGERNVASQGATSRDVAGINKEAAVETTTISTTSAERTAASERVQRQPLIDAQVRASDAANAMGEARLALDKLRTDSESVRDMLRIKIESGQLDEITATRQFNEWHSTAKYQTETHLKMLEMAENARVNSAAHGRDIAQMQLQAAQAQMPYMIPTAQLESAQGFSSAMLSNSQLGTLDQSAPMPAQVFGGPMGTGATAFNFQPGGNMDPAALAAQSVAAMQQQLGKGVGDPGALPNTGAPPAPGRTLAEQGARLDIPEMPSAQALPAPTQYVAPTVAA